MDHLLLRLGCETRPVVLLQPWPYFNAISKWRIWVDRSLVPSRMRLQNASKHWSCNAFLHVVRCDTEPLYKEFGVAFRLPGSSKELHETPFGAVQQLLCCYSRFE